MFPYEQSVPKRQRSPSLDRATKRSIVKKQCEDKHPDRWVPNARFWDTLPRIHLTRRALIELDRRNRQQKIPTTEETAHPRRRSARLRRRVLQERVHLLPCIGDKRPNRQLQRFARGGGPDLTCLRGWPDPTMSDLTSRHSRSITNTGLTTSSRRSTPYDANYEAKLFEAGVFLIKETDEKNDCVMPTNYKNIMMRLDEARPSLSPSRFTERDFNNFQEQADLASTETTTLQRVMPVIEGNNNQFESLQDLSFNNIKPFNPDIAVAKPDSYDGALPSSIDNRVLNDLSEYITPSTDPSRPAAPNFFLEGKSRRGRADVAKRQAAHAGAIGTRGMMSLQSYPSQALIYDKNASSFTSTYHDGQLKIYTTHATAPKTPDGPPQYHMTQLRTFAMTDSSRTFREGATHYRNARDLAKELRDESIQKANLKARQMPTSKRSSRSQSNTNTLTMHTSLRGEEQESPPDSETSTDELAPDKVSKRSRNVTLVEDDQDDAGRMSFAMSTPDRDLAASAKRTSQIASTKARSKTVMEPTSQVNRDPSYMSFTTSSTYSSPTGRIEAAYRPDSARPTKISLPESSADIASRMHLGMSPAARRQHSRRQQPSKQIAAPQLQEVCIERIQQDQRRGFEFTARRRKVFIPYEEWEKVKKSGRDAWVNWEWMVYCLDDLVVGREEVD